MERTNGIQSRTKKTVAVLFLLAAMASTGCGQNALMNPTADQLSSSGSSVPGKGGNDRKPVGNDRNPASGNIKTSVGNDLNP